MRDPFGPGIRFKVLLWRTEKWLRRQHRLVWYVLGLYLGWVICSEYNLWLDTGRWTWFPWQ